MGLSVTTSACILFAVIAIRLFNPEKRHTLYKHNTMTMHLRNFWWNNATKATFWDDEVTQWSLKEGGLGALARRFAAAIDAPLIFCAPSVPTNVTNIFKVILARLHSLQAAVHLQDQVL